MENAQNEIQKQFRQQQEKYTYYVIALSVTALGFTILKTAGLPLKLSQIPVGIAVLSWGISIFCGLKFLSYTISNLFANNTYFDILQGQFPGVGNHPERIEAASTGIMQAMQSNSNKGSTFGKWQNRLFYLGIVSYITWHVLEMYLVNHTIL